MSENITHTAVLDDCIRLMLHADSICGPFKVSASEYWDFMRLGGVTRSGDTFTVQLLERYRDAWPKRTPEQRVEPKLAFVLGWLCHRAADRQMKPVFRETDPHKKQSPSECSVYHDAFVLREVFAGGAEGPYKPGMFGNGFVSHGIEEAFRALWQRMLAAMHTFIPDRQDIEGWLDRLFQLQQRFTVDLSRYARAIESPDPELVRRFIVDPNFYDRNDPILLAARAIQRGQQVGAEQINHAVAAPASSHYAQAVQNGFGYLRTASDFFEGRLNADELGEKLDIGKPGRDGKSV
jgi:hypothetical protein